MLLSKASSLSCNEKLSSKNRSTEYGGFLHLNTWPKLLSQNHSLYSDNHCLNQNKYFKVYIPSAVLQIGTGSQFLSDLVWVRIVVWAWRPTWGRMWEKGPHSASPVKLSRVPTDPLTPPFPGLPSPPELCKVNRGSCLHHLWKHFTHSKGAVYTAKQITGRNYWSV